MWNIHSKFKRNFKKIFEYYPLCIHPLQRQHKNIISDDLQNVSEQNVSVQNVLEQKVSEQNISAKKGLGNRK